jgi:hypothetical protein
LIQYFENIYANMHFWHGIFFPWLELMVLLKYYADQGGQSSLKALEAVKVRFGANAAVSPVMTKSPVTSRLRAAVLPDFFQLASA